MSPVNNPFRSRYTEMQRDRSGFLSTFSTSMLEALPNAGAAWNRLIVLRSAPGAGKTSILRMITPDSLSAFTGRERDDHLRELSAALEERGVLQGGRSRVLGLMIGVGKDYRSLIDLGPKGPGALKIFFKLLDARIMTRAIEASLAASEKQFPDDVGSVEFVPRDGTDGERARLLARRLFGSESAEEPSLRGGDMLTALRLTERSVLSLLGSLMPVRWDDVEGHSELTSLEFLAATEIRVDGRPLGMRPVLLFDDVHDLESGQRAALYNELLVRDPRVGRWISERRSAVPLNELLVGKTQGREYELVELEEHLRQGGPSRLRQVMTAIGNSRAVSPLASMHRSEPFSDLLTGQESIPDGDADRAYRAADQRMRRLCEEHPAYGGWLRDAYESESDDEPILDRAVRLRELSILVERNVKRQTPTLFEMDDWIDPSRAATMSGSSTRTAARLFLAKEQKLPYYAGPAVLAELSSRNIEQYLSLAGDQFDLITSALTVRGRSPYLSALEQDTRIRRASRDMWDSIPRRVPNGNDVQSLLLAIATHSRAETFRPSAPYAPGATGTALEWSEARALFRGRLRGEGFDRLSAAFGNAVANNLLETSHVPTSVKNSAYQVFYLNRMLLPHFDLPLQRGGFREHPATRLLDMWAKAAGRRRGLVPDMAEVDAGFDDGRLI